MTWKPKSNINHHVWNLYWPPQPMSDSGLCDHDLIVTSVSLTFDLWRSFWHSFLCGTWRTVHRGEQFLRPSPPAPGSEWPPPHRGSDATCCRKGKGQGQACCHQSDFITKLSRRLWSTQKQIRKKHPKLYS